MSGFPVFISSSTDKAVRLRGRTKGKVEGTGAIWPATLTATSGSSLFATGHSKTKAPPFGGACSFEAMVAELVYCTRKRCTVVLTNFWPGRRTVLGKFGWFGLSGKCWVSRQSAPFFAYFLPLLPVNVPSR